MATVTTLKTKVKNGFDPDVSYVPPAYHVAFTVSTDVCQTCLPGLAPSTLSLFVDPSFVAPAWHGASAPDAVAVDGVPPTTAGGPVGQAPGAYVYFKATRATSSTSALTVMQITSPAGKPVAKNRPTYFAGSDAVGSGPLPTTSAIGNAVDAYDASTLVYSAAVGATARTEGCNFLLPSAEGGGATGDMFTTAGHIPTSVGGEQLRAYPVVQYTAESTADPPAITPSTRFVLAWVTPLAIQDGVRTQDPQIAKYGFDATAGFPVLATTLYTSSPCAEWCGSVASTLD